MNTVDDILKLLFKRVPVKRVIDGQIVYNDFKKTEFVRLAFPYKTNYSESELANMWEFYRDTFVRERRNESQGYFGGLSGIKPFDAVFYYVKHILTVQDNQVVCQYNQLLNWRRVTVELGEDLFVAAYWARYKTPSEMKLIGFSWPTVVGHNNYQLNRMMQRKISENHFHLYGSMPMFHISWLSLMNNILDSKGIENLKQYDLQRRNANIRYNSEYVEESLCVQYCQAAVIRLYLFSELMGYRIRLGKYHVPVRGYLQYIDIDDVFMQNGIDGERRLSVDDLKDILASRGKSCFVPVLLREALKKRYDDIEQNEYYRFICMLREIFSEVVCTEGYFDSVRSVEVSLAEVIRMLMPLIGSIDLETLRPLLPEDLFLKEWQKITLRNTVDIIRNRYFLEENILAIQDIIDGFRNYYLRADGCAGRMEDYALLGVRDDNYGFDQYNTIFSGERWLMYSYLNQIWKGNEEPERTNLFYAYMLIKENIRAELIQSNRNVGFDNFRKYERRKAELILDPIFKNVIVRWAVRENLMRGNIQSLEIRITPRDTVRKNMEYIKSLDEIIGDSKERYFYTFHFLKSPDTKVADSPFNLEYVHCRHYKKRKEIKRIAQALIGLREKYPECAGRVLGIDAASQEIGCRPEVFGSVFRYLKYHMKIVNDGLTRKTVPQLRITYHVGEDFLDVADGLRAIDEAVNFLNMDCGDRLGHAIALGIDVDEWYASKNYRIYLTQQDYLDNLVWLYHQLIRFEIDGTDVLRDYIQKKFSDYFNKIFLKHMDIHEMQRILADAGNPGQMSMDGRFHFDISHYYDAWKVRGDDPSLYERGYFQKPEQDFSIRDMYVNRKFPVTYNIREIPEVFLLYYNYHFNKMVRKEGEKRIEIKVRPFYVEGVKAVQKEMQKFIASQGIGIETNPSSNYLIGTFRDYGKHPILNFYNKGLVYDVEALENCPQMCVSINTDDSGVFSTSLENEYALLACALEQKVDTNGKPIYNRTNIYEWIDSVRQMGNDQSFLQKTGM